MFALALNEERDDDGELFGVTFKFTVSGYEYALFNPYFTSGEREDWETLLEAVRNPKTYRTTVKIRGVSDDSCDYAVSVDERTVIFSTDYECTGYQTAMDLMIPAYACEVVFERMLAIVSV